MRSRNTYEPKMRDEDIDVDISACCATGRRSVSATQQIQPSGRAMYNLIRDFDREELFLRVFQGFVLLLEPAAERKAPGIAVLVRK